VQDQETLDVVFVGDKTGHKIKAKKKDTPPNPSNALENVTISQFEVPSARFDAQSYVDHVFECEDEETIRTLFQEKLSEMKENAATHLQRVVHRNYQQFIAASKEILSTRTYAQF
jgi:peptide subunit release factor RF-3